jgi:hypothetical protein
LHWVTVALVVLLVGLQTWVLPPPPPPPADPTHWSTVTAGACVPTGTLLVTLTVQYVLLPPPYTMPLHWFTDVTSWLKVVVLVTGPTLRGQEGNATPAAAKHAVAVTVELVAPLELTVLTTVRMQFTWSASPEGNSGGLH